MPTCEAVGEQKNLAAHGGGLGETRNVGVSSGSVHRRALARHFFLTRQAGAWRSQGGAALKAKEWRLAPPALR